MPPSRVVRQAGDAQERDGARLRGDDGDEHQPPAHVAVADEVGVEIVLFPREPDAEQQRGQAVGDDDGHVHRRQLCEEHRVSVLCSAVAAQKTTLQNSKRCRAPHSKV